MAKIAKNTTGSPLVLRDIGVTIAASATYTIHPGDYYLWAASTDAVTAINTGSLVINDGYDDLKKTNSIRHLQEESLARSTGFNVAAVVQPTAAGTITLDSTSRLLYAFTGTTPGQVVVLPNATTLNVAHRFEFWHTGTAAVTINYNNGAHLTSAGGGQRTTVTLIDNTTQNGVWAVDSNFTGGGGTGTDLDSKQFGRQGTISNGTFLLTLNNVPSDTSPDIMPYDFYFRRLSWANSNNAGAFTIRIWKIDTTLNPATKAIVWDETVSGRAGYMNYDVNIPINMGDGVFIEIPSVSSPRPADLNVIISLRQR